MAGVKGRSGRKNKFEEGQLIDVLNSSLKIIQDFFNSDNIPLKDKALIAKDFVTKKIPSALQHTGSQIKDMQIVIVRADGTRDSLTTIPRQVPVQQ